MDDGQNNDPGGWQAATSTVDTPWAARLANVTNGLKANPGAFDQLAAALKTSPLQLPPIAYGAQQSPLQALPSGPQSPQMLRPLGYQPQPQSGGAGGVGGY